MEYKISKEVIKIRENTKKAYNIESYERMIKINDDLINRGLTKKRGYSLATISDVPYEYSGNDKKD